MGFTAGINFIYSIFIFSIEAYNYHHNRGIIPNNLHDKTDQDLYTYTFRALLAHSPFGMTGLQEKKNGSWDYT